MSRSGGSSRSRFSEEQLEHRRAQVPEITVPEELPIAERAEELRNAIRDHQVVIVAGETGSGKSTQLPKLCLQLGRGITGLIGHTQPRRVAARTIAERVAEELGTELGGIIGYTVRFTDRVGENTLVKVMTDGILLAETQRDRMLSRYDTLIIDEAHERSLNVDFLLGYIKQLLPRRPDLKVIITSATIDTQRFSEHFADASGRSAPIIEVSGRTHPVEMRYRPYGGADPEDPKDDRDQVQAIADAVDELGREGPGDVLVFLSGEREIHDTADALRRLDLRNTDVLPLYARLSAAEQHRIFQPHTGRRIVLSTNIAETSLTVPGVRYVIDAGSARISRYSARLKVQRLPIEAVSQASANQRAGRCGRVAPGICIRLYSEDDFNSRDAFTEPEVLRTNLASVILQMIALGLGDVAAFPFLDAPDGRAIRDGISLLEELGALEQGLAADERRLTKLGRQLAQLPLDPRLARMIIEADRHGCVREVLVITAALSIQDPRERPAEHRPAADEMHRRFHVEGSDFLTLVKLWDHLREQQREMSSSQFRKLCRTEYLNYLRVREWQDLYSQLRQVAGQLQIRPGSDAGHPDRVHQAVLSGLLSHIGMRDGLTREFRGARGAKFVIGNGSALGKKLPKWVMAAELVETSRLFGRMVAGVQPEWAERLAPHLITRSYGEPRWDVQRGGAVTTERVSLYGLPIITGRTVGYERVDVAVARSMFVRHALATPEELTSWHARHRFFGENQAVIDRTRAIAERTRSALLIDDEAIVAFYDRRVAADVVTTRHFDRWWKDARSSNPQLLRMTPDDLSIGAPAGSLTDFPGVWRQGDHELVVTYRFEPGQPADGATVHVPVALLNQITDVGFDWHVAGFREELVHSLLRSLPKTLRRDLVPAAETGRRAFAALGAQEGSFHDALAAAFQQVSGVRVRATDFDASKVPDHLRIGFAIEDEHGRVLAYGKDLAPLRERFRTALRSVLAEAASSIEQRGLTDWTFGDLPNVVDVDRAGNAMRGYPALLDNGESVAIRVLTNADLQARVMRAGVRRLLLLTVPPSRRTVEKPLSNQARLAIAAVGLMTEAALVDDCINATVDALLDAHGVPWTEAAFRELQRDARGEITSRAASLVAASSRIVIEAASVVAQLDRLHAPALRPSVDDANAHLARLLRPGFVSAAGPDRIADVGRYVQAIGRRLEKLSDGPARDRQHIASATALEARYATLLARLGRGEATPEVVDVGWGLEELRVSLFVQAMATKRPVSVQRLAKELSALGG